MRLLKWLADRPTPQIPERYLRYVDQYFRAPRHAYRPGRPTGWGMRAWLKDHLDVWYAVREEQGITAAIALGL